MASGEANIKGDCINIPRASGGLGGPQTPAKISLFPLHPALPGDKEKKKNIEDVSNCCNAVYLILLLILYSVMGATIMMEKIISIHLK